MGPHVSAVLVALVAGSAGWANTYTVTNTSNGGAGSLRRAINDANARIGADTIAFTPGVSGGTVRPLTPLPAITDEHTTINADIDGDGAPDVTLNGNRMDGGMEGNWGLDIAADYCEVIGLALGAIPGPGVILNGASHCVIHSCHIGVNRAGTSRLPNSLYDIAAYDADDNQIGSADPAQRNVICGGTLNRFNSGILVMDSSHNTIIGNHIGVTRDGTAALGEGYVGVWLFQREGTCTDNTVGGATPEERNLFGGLLYGVSLSGEAESNEIKGNYFGLAADGSTVLPIQSAGVVVRGRRNVVGGTDPGDRNVFAGEAEDGVQIEGGHTAGNRIQGNYFGLTADGTATCRLHTGVHVTGGAEAQTIGGTSRSHGNYFCAAAPSGAKRGVFFERAGAGSVVRNNTFGLYPSGGRARLLNVGVKIGQVAVTVRNNTIARCLNGIQVSGASANPLVLANNLRNCGTAVAILNNARCRLGNVRTKLGEGRNHFRSTNSVHIANLTPLVVKAEGNDFGTTDRDAINAKIWDSRDHPDLGRVDFSPLMGGAVPTGETEAPLALSGLAAVPSAAGAQITFTLSAAAQVHARVLNIAGRPIKTLCHWRGCEAGTNTLLWNAASDGGLSVPNGTYLVEVTVRAEDGAQARALSQVSLQR